MPYTDPTSEAARAVHRRAQAKYHRSDKGQATDRKRWETRAATGKVAAYTRANRAARRAYLEQLFWPSPDKRVIVPGVTRVVVINDLQIPFEDPKAVNEAVNVIGRVRPDCLVINGDGLDCYRESAFLQDWRLAKDVTEEQHRRARALMKLLQPIPRKIWLGGNHEERWWRIIKDMHARNLSEKAAPVVANLLAYTKHLGTEYEIRINDPIQSFARLFDMPKHGFSYYPYSHRLYFADRNLVVTHGKYVSRHSGYAAKRSYEWLGRSCIVGHTHREGKHSITQDGRQHAAWENCCLCQLEPEYDDAPNWQQGLCAVEIDGPTFRVVPVPIVRETPHSAPVAVYSGL